MTSNEDQDYPYYRSPSSIRNKTFTRRRRGADEEEVSGYLVLLAEQVQASDKERREIGAENEHLRAHNARLQAELQQVRSQLSEAEQSGSRVNDQVVEMFSQAQLVAEEMVEDVSRDARQRLTQARAQERQILEEAMQTAERTLRDAEAMMTRTSPGTGGSSSYAGGSFGREPGRPGASEVDQVRSMARAAQEQMQSIMDAFASQMSRLGDAPPSQPGYPSPHLNGSAVNGLNGWQIEAPRGRDHDSRGSD